MEARETSFIENSLKRLQEIKSENIENHYESCNDILLNTPPMNFSHSVYRNRKRSYNEYESESDESVEKWIKVDYDSESYCVNPFGNSNQFNGSTGQSFVKRWKDKNRLRTNYGLRPRSVLRKCWSEGDADIPRKVSRKGNRCRTTNRTTLSRYRRNTANARERERMKEINTAFTALRGVLPSFATAQMSSMTKITTLQLASSYIRALSDMLNDNEENNDANQDDENKTSVQITNNQEIPNVEFNNNTDISNKNYRYEQNLVSDNSSVMSCSSKFELSKQCSVSNLPRDSSHSSILERCPSFLSDYGSERNGPDDTLIDDYLLTWGDLTPQQNFCWDSN